MEHYNAGLTRYGSMTVQNCSTPCRTTQGSTVPVYKGHNVGSTANLKVGGEGEIDAGQQLDEDQQDY